MHLSGTVVIVVDLDTVCLQQQDGLCGIDTIHCQIQCLSLIAVVWFANLFLIHFGHGMIGLEFGLIYCWYWSFHIDINSRISPDLSFKGNELFHISYYTFTVT